MTEEPTNDLARRPGEPPTSYRSRLIEAACTAISVEAAEQLAVGYGVGPLQAEPSVNAADFFDWSLLMTAVWVAWRDMGAVTRFADHFREHSSFFSFQRGASDGPRLRYEVGRPLLSLAHVLVWPKHFLQTKEDGEVKHSFGGGDLPDDERWFLPVINGGAMPLPLMSLQFAWAELQKALRSGGLFASAIECTSGRRVPKVDPTEWIDIVLGSAPDGTDALGSLVRTNRTKARYAHSSHETLVTGDIRYVDVRIEQSAILAVWPPSQISRTRQHTPPATQFEDPSIGQHGSLEERLANFQKHVLEVIERYPGGPAKGADRTSLIKAGRDSFGLKRDEASGAFLTAQAAAQVSTWGGRVGRRKKPNS
jgi:hypothetical protein